MSPKAFSAQEKELVHARLLDAAEQFLATTGIRKTSVEELARAAGISKGAFYLFFESKEMLFLDALEREQARIHQAILEQVAAAPTRREGFVSAVTRMYRGFVAKPWLFSFAGEDYELLLRRIPPQRIERHIEMDNDSVRRLQALLGDEVALQPEMVSAALRMLFLGTLHRKEVGEQWADEAFEFMVQAMAAQMFQGGRT